MGMISRSRICRFTGLKIEPGRGILFVKDDGELFYFLNSKAKKLQRDQKKKPSKIGWTTAYRKLHKKNRMGEVNKRKKHASIKTMLRPYDLTSAQNGIRGKPCEKSHEISYSQRLKQIL